MAHFAQIDENNIVTEVLVLDNEGTVEACHAFLVENLGGTWIQTSYNTYRNQHALGGTPLRKNYAGIGYTYDESRDAFIEPQTYPSWVFNEDVCGWDPPVPFPEDTPHVHWDEGTTSWVANDKPDQPFPSWVWSDDNWWWDPPVLPPEDFDDDPSKYDWNEETQTWDAV